MSFNQEHSRDKRHKRRAGTVPLQSRGRYDVWSRTQSDTFRKDVADRLAKRAGITLDLSLDPYTTLLAVPDPDWSDGAYLRNQSLVQIKALFQKDEDLVSPIDKEQVAVTTFLDSEASCKSVNDAILENRLGGEHHPDVECILMYAQRKMVDLLGPAPKIADLKPSFGPGAAVTCRKKTSARFKLSTLPSISKPSLGILFQMTQGVRRWLELHSFRVIVVPGVLEFVNKNYKTYRAIVIGPSLTGAYQRALGSLMKLRLRHSGIDLYGAKNSITGGQGHQRERARLASLTGLDATIDLKAASDTKAYMLIMNLTPIDWFELMDSLRDDRVLYQGKSIELEKFSSMGCGFTFELETAVFYSLAYGIARHYGIPINSKSISVYGDDIIVPRELGQKIVEVFPLFGFTVNRDKSFLDGPFRESCGGDYVLGVDVRPFFVRDRMTHHKLVSFYNHFTRKPHQDPNREIRELILSVLPAKFRNFGPDGYGDGHLISNADVTTYAKPLGREFGYSGWTFETYVEIPKKDKTPMIGDQLLPAYSIYLRQECDPEYVKMFEAADLMKGPLKDAFIRQTLLDIGAPLDHFVLRKGKGERSKARKIRVYVLGPS